MTEDNRFPEAQTGAPRRLQDVSAVMLPFPDIGRTDPLGASRLKSEIIVTGWRTVLRPVLTHMLPNDAEAQLC